MTNFKNLKKIINETYINKLNINKELLIKSFVIYYGEKYETYIRNKFNHIIYCWYTSDFIINYYDEIMIHILNECVENTIEILKILGLIKNDLKYDFETGKLINYNNLIQLDYGRIFNTYNEKEQNLDNILKYLFDNNRLLTSDFPQSNLYNFFSLEKKEQHKFANIVFSKNELTNEDLYKIKSAIKYIELIKEDIFNIEKIKEKIIMFSEFSEYAHKKLHNKMKIIGLKNEFNLNDEVMKNLKKNFLNVEDVSFVSTIGDQYFLVAFPILISSDYDLIHEINHAITSSLLAIFKENKEEYYLFKLGLFLENENDITFEEIINEKSSIEITKIFQNLGGKIFDNQFFNYEKSAYKSSLPLINRFYQENKEDLKEARISENRNLLYRNIDKQLYQEYEKFVIQVTSRLKENENETLTKEEILYAANLVKKLNKRNKIED